MNNLKLANPKMMDIAVPANVKVGLAQEKIALRGWAVTATQALSLVGKPDIALIDLRERSGTRTSRHDTRLAARPLPGFAGKHQRRRHAAASLRNRRTSVLLFYCAFGERSAMAVQAARRRGPRILVFPYPGRHRRLEENVRPAQSLKSPHDTRAGF